MSSHPSTYAPHRSSRAQTPEALPGGNPTSGVRTLALAPLEPLALTPAQVRSLKSVVDRLEPFTRRRAGATTAVPKEQVETVIYPVVGGVEGLTDLVNEHKARSRAYEREKRKVFRSSYTNHYRTGLITLLRLLEFRSNNAEHQPVLDGLKLILRFADSKAELYPPEVPVVLDGVVKADWREFAISTDHRGRRRVVRIVYECSVLEALRDRLRCKGDLGGRRR